MENGQFNWLINAVNFCMAIPQITAEKSPSWEANHSSKPPWEPLCELVQCFCTETRSRAGTPDQDWKAFPFTCYIKSHVKAFISTAASPALRAAGAHTDDRNLVLLVHSTGYNPVWGSAGTHLTAAAFQFLMPSTPFGTPFLYISCSQSWCEKSKFPINMII